MKNLNKKILIISIFILIALLVLVFPKVDALNDGGTKIYKSLTYEIAKVHKIKEDSLNEFYEGTIVKIFGKEVYNDLTKDVKIVVDGKEPVTTNKRYEKNIDNITLSLTIPDNWKYEELERNTENDFYKYALKIYKDNADKYAVLYYYQQMFGVCGTGRTSEQIELESGIKANIGYYYGKDIWEDISFYETNKYIAIINYGLDKVESEEAINFVKTLNIAEISNKKENISLLLNEETLTSRNATFILKNDSNKTYTYGAEYEIEVKGDSEWCKIELDTPLSWNEMLYSIKPNTTNELNIDFTIGYGELSKGKRYRFVKKVREEGKTDDVYLYAEFEIK